MILMKQEYLILLSFLLTFAVVTNAFYLKKQFYPSIVYLTKSSASLAILYVQAFVFIILFGKFIQKLFLGQLRAIEIEHLYDRAWFSITETCLAFTVFRDDLSPRFVALFAMLLFLKCFHWLLEDRVDYMEQSPSLGPIFHMRVISLSSILSVLDYLFISWAYAYTMTKGASVQIVFGFEYAILFVSVCATTIKYVLHSIEIRSGQQWDNKGVCMLYSDLVIGVVRVSLYLTFIAVMMKIHTFPLFAIRPMFVAIRAFRKSCNDILESRRAIHYLNTMYSDLTVDELATISDTTCIICREEMQAQQSIKRLSCKHVFHKNCLRSWFQRQQTCPICRTTVLNPTPPATPRQPPAAAAAANDQQPTPPPASSAPAPPTTNPDSATSTTPTNSQSASVNNTTTPNPNRTDIETFLQTSFNPFSMVLPPFAFPPPPLPPINFTGMSEEAIREMERTELAHVQARIQCLSNVKTLLDASMIQMQQYLNIISQCSRDNRTHTSNNSDELISSSWNNNATTNSSNLMGENNADEIRRRRLEVFQNRAESSTTIKQENKND